MEMANGGGVLRLGTGGLSSRAKESTAEVIAMAESKEQA